MKQWRCRVGKGRKMPLNSTFDKLHLHHTKLLGSKHKFMSGQPRLSVWISSPPSFHLLLIQLLFCPAATFYLAAGHRRRGRRSESWSVFLQRGGAAAALELGHPAAAASCTCVFCTTRCLCTTSSSPPPRQTSSAAARIYFAKLRVWTPLPLQGSSTRTKVAALAVFVSPYSQLMASTSHALAVSQQAPTLFPLYVHNEVTTPTYHHCSTSPFQFLQF